MHDFKTERRAKSINVLYNFILNLVILLYKHTNWHNYKNFIFNKKTKSKKGKIISNNK